MDARGAGPAGGRPGAAASGADRPAQRQGPGEARLPGRYQLQQQLGEQDGSVAWKATDRALRRPVLVRTFTPGCRRAGEVVAAARAAARLNDARLVQVFDANDDPACPYVVTEWPAGSRLDDLLRAGPLAPARAARAIAGAADALAAAHAAGVSHLCLTPDAVWLDRWGEVKISGLGTAAALSGASAADPALADTRGLARLLYAALTGYWPGPQQTALPPAPRHGRHPARPGRLRAGIPAGLAGVTWRALCGEAVGTAPPILGPARLAMELATFTEAGGPADAPGRAPAVVAGPRADWARPPDGQLTQTRADEASGRPRHLPAEPPHWTAGGTLPGLPDGLRGTQDAAGPGGVQGAAGPGGVQGAAGPGGVPGAAGPGGGPGGMREAPGEGGDPRPGTDGTPPAAAGRWPGTAGGEPPEAAGVLPARLPGEGDQPPERAADEPPTPLTPDPLLAGPLVPAARPGGRGSRGRVLGGLVLLLAVLAAGVGGWLLTQRAPGGSATGGQPAGPAELLRPARAASFGVNGSGQGDNGQLASLAIDRSRGTAWHTDWYTTARFGNLAPGTGLLLDLGRPAAVASARLTLGPARGAGVQLRAGDSAAVLADLVPVARASGAGGQVLLRAAHPVTGRYLLIWFTRLPPRGDGTFQGSIYDVRLRGHR